MNKKCINITAYSQHILHEDTLYNINRQKYKTVCGELPFIKDIFDRLAMILYGICLYCETAFFVCFCMIIVVCICV